MPRLLIRKTPLTLKERIERSKRTRISGTFRWVDPFPFIPGTLPEKMVYAELSARQIPFRFQEWLNTYIEGLESNQWHRPDFILDQYKIVIEIQGFYWHTKPEVIEADSLKYAMMELTGWRVIRWWDFEIQENLQNLVDAVPELRRSSRVPIGQPVPHAGRWYNDSRGAAKRNKRLRKPWTKRAVGGKIRSRKRKIIARGIV